MTGSKYNLRSSERERAEESDSGETIQPEQHNVLASQLTNQALPVELVTVGGVESVQTASTKGDQATNEGKGTGIRLNGKVIETDILQDVIFAFRVVKSVPPPPIPLCRLVINEAIRTVLKNVSELGIKFHSMGYVRELGTFLVSTKRAGEAELEVDRYDLDDWGPVWREVNKEYEEDLAQTPEWQHLANKKFIIWDGNHRATAWMKRIKEDFPLNKARHIRVDYTFIETRRHQEGELILALNSINRLIRVHVPHSLLHDVFMLQKFGMSDKQTLLRWMPMEDRYWMEAEMRVERKGPHKPWYNVPMSILAQLVFKDDYTRLLNQATSRIDKANLSLEDCQAQYDAAIKTVESSVKDKAYKISFIANPANGAGFFQILYKLDWDAKGLVVTEDKLQMIASSSVGPTKKREVLGILAGDRATRDSHGMSSDNKGFRKYMCKEIYWWHMIELAKTFLAELSIGSDMSTGDDDVFFRRQRHLHFHDAFGDLVKNMKNSAVAEKQPQLALSARRLVYR